MKYGSLIAAALMASGAMASSYSADALREMPTYLPPRRERSSLRRLISRPRSRYMPHSGKKEMAKHLARRAAGVVEAAPLLMAA